MSEDAIMTVSQVAAYLKMSRAAIYRLVAQGQLPHIRIGKSRRIRRVELEMWLKKQTVLPRAQ